MITRQFAFSLDGDVPLHVFAAALKHWDALLRAIAKEAHVDSHQHMLSGLDYGSAAVYSTLTVEDEAVADALSRRVEEVGIGMRRHTLQRFPEPIAKPARGLLRDVTKGVGNPLTVSTEVTDILVLPARDDLTTSDESLQETTTPVSVEAYGGLTGRIQTLTSRNALRFTLFDSLHDRAVRCILSSDQHHLLQELDTRAYVEGWITRDYHTGRPLTIRRISKVLPSREEPDRTAYRQVRGILRDASATTERPEHRLRRMRNG